MIPTGEAKNVQLMFRPVGVYQNASIRVLDGENEIMRQKKAVLTPGEMVELTLLPEKLKG